MEGFIDGSRWHRGSRVYVLGQDIYLRDEGMEGNDRYHQQLYGCISGRAWKQRIS